jgi:cytochrome c
LLIYSEPLSARLVDPAGLVHGRTTLKIALASLGLMLAALTSGTASAQDAEAGQRVFGQCRACHQVGETAKNGVGPHLNGLFERAAGAVEGYSFSDANKKSGIKWDEANFATYIENPRGVMPGTKMVYAGLKNPQQVKDLTAYLKTFAPDGKTK